MFDLGFQELIIIFVVALLVFGPKKLPEVGRSLGRGLAELKKAMRGIQDSMREEEDFIRKQVPDVKTPLGDIVQEIKDTEATVKGSTSGEPHPNPEHKDVSSYPQETKDTSSSSEERGDGNAG